MSVFVSFAAMLIILQVSHSSITIVLGADDVTGNNFMIPGMVFDNTPRGDGSGKRQVAFFLDINPNLIESSPVYKMNQGRSTLCLNQFVA